MNKKIAVVSGGAGGIGRAVIARLSEDGFFSVILDRDVASGENVVAGLLENGKNGKFIPVDLMSKSSVQNAITEVDALLGGISLLINLAGGTLHPRLVQDLSLQQWQTVIDTNLKTTFFCCQAAVPIMKRQRKGIIINISSVFGSTGSVTRTAYSASKAAIVALTKSLALELASFGIRVNAISPALVNTDRVRKNLSPEAWDRIKRTIPMGAVMDTEDVAEGVAFLASEVSAYATGQTLNVNGGSFMP